MDIYSGISCNARVPDIWLSGLGGVTMPCFRCGQRKRTNQIRLAAHKLYDTLPEQKKNGEWVYVDSEAWKEFKERLKEDRRE